jgi:hypothetical protein
VPTPSQISRSYERPRWLPWHGAAHYLRQIYLRGVTEENLRHRPFHSGLLRDLEQFIDAIPYEIKYLMDVRRWRLDALRQRDPNLAKPRIELDLGVTSKDNLTLRWYPLGEHEHFYRGQNAIKSDFHDSVAILADNLYARQRPENEVLFMHGFRSVAYELRDPSEAGDLARLLVLGAFAAVCEWERFLYHSFEVSKDTWFDFVEEDCIVIDWTLYDVQERAAKQEQEWFVGFEAEHGMSPRNFLAMLAEFHGWNKHDNFSKELKARGLKITPGTVRKIAERLRTKHHVVWREAGLTDDS